VDGTKTLIDHARDAAQHSYAPRSLLHVGTAIQTANDIYQGANFENDSYGATICAERAAMAHVLAHEGQLNVGPEIRRIALYAEWDSRLDTKPTLVTVSPCGICRQVLYQFAPTAGVEFLLDGAYTTKTVQELLVHPFELASLEGRGPERTS